MRDLNRDTVTASVITMRTARELLYRGSVQWTDHEGWHKLQFFPRTQFMDAAQEVNEWLEKNTKETQ